MGCSDVPKTIDNKNHSKEKDKKNEDNKQYKVIKSRIDSMSKDDPKISKGFLLGSSSIQKFIKIIDNSKNSKQPKEQKELNNNEDLKKNIEIFQDFKKCQTLIFTNNKEKNSFFIVDEDFLKKNNLSNIFGQNTKVEIDKINNKIIFPSTEVLKYRKKKGKPFCEFVYNKDDDGNKNNEIKIGYGNNINKTERHQLMT